MIMIIILNEVIMFPLVKIQLNSNQFVLSKINYVVKDLNSLSLVFKERGSIKNTQINWVE